MLMPVNLIVFHIKRALLVLHGRGILAHTTIAALGIIIPPTEVNQIEKETIKGALRC
jgi:hypothetical protein